MGIPEEPASPPAAPVCPVCGEAFSRSTVVLCRECSAPHHRKCWKFNKGCATYGCRCRTFVLPPVAAGDELVFSARGTPDPFWVILLVPLFIGGLVGLPAVLGKALFEVVFPVLLFGFVSGILGATVGPLLTERRYLLSPGEGAIHRQVRFGPLKVSERKAWKTFSDVEELEVRSARVLGGQKGQEAHQQLQLWMRDKEGTRHLLDTAHTSERDSVIDKAQAAADVLDSTLELPREVEAPRALPEGLKRAMAALPASETEARPDPDEPG